MAKNNIQVIIVLVLIALGVSGIAYLINYKDQQTQPSTQYGAIKKFSSIEEIKTFLETKQNQGYYGGYGLEATTMKTTVAGTPAPLAAQAGTRDSSVSQTYSTTNIQVQGVDEPDFIKNDGDYIYIAQGEKVIIVAAYPPEDAKILSEIDINDTPQEIFIKSDKLIVFGQERYSYEPIPLAEDTSVSPAGAAKASVARIMPPIYYNPKSFIKVYDISDRQNPSLFNQIVYDGSYYDARMIGDFIYTIVNQPVYYRDDNVILPTIKQGQTELKIAPQEIYYFDIPDYSYQLTTVLAFDINSKQELEKKSFLTGYTQTIYVSKDNIYLTSQKQISYIDYQEKLTNEVLLKVLDTATADKIRQVLKEDISAYEKQSKIQDIYEQYFNTLPEGKKEQFQKDLQEKYKEVEIQIQKELQKTIIHKINIKATDIEYKARGEVPGTLLNQFSMDENKGYFRVATTTGEVWQGTSSNNIYVLDEDLDIVGKLEDLGLKERIYSTRFIGDRLYMVTFKKIDPLFVIDLSNPTSPKVLGELKIPGYSDYLHPYDENHIIGIGKEAVDATQDETQQRELDFAWYQGIKISLFDVSDVSNPKEISKFNIGDRGTDSEALYEHKAFLFDRQKKLLVIPVTEAKIDSSDYKGVVPPNAYGKPVFQGAYVLSVNLQDGFKQIGRITHTDKEPDKTQDYYYYDYLTQIRRSLYIDDTLYTVSTKYIKANDLQTLQDISQVKLPVEQPDYPVIMY